MITIYVDATATRESGAADRLRHLSEAGHELVLVGPPDERPFDPTAWAARTSALPETRPRGSWFITADPAACSDRQVGLRTVLIGPRSDAPRPTRCDSTARGLREAVLEILAADAMG